MSQLASTQKDWKKFVDGGHMNSLIVIIRTKQNNFGDVIKKLLLQDENSYGQRK